MPPKTTQGGQNAAASISPTNAENGKKSPFASTKQGVNDKRELIELFNVHDGAEYISEEERQAHPNAEYFTAEIDKKYVGEVLPAWELDDAQSVVITFRKIVTVKSGKIADVTKSWEESRFAAGKRNGKFFLLVGEQNDFETEIVGFGVGVVTRSTK